MYSEPSVHRPILQNGGMLSTLCVTSLKIKTLSFCRNFAGLDSRGHALRNIALKVRYSLHYDVKLLKI